MWIARLSMLNVLVISNVSPTHQNFNDYKVRAFSDWVFVAENYVKLAINKI